MPDKLCHKDKGGILESEGVVEAVSAAHEDDTPVERNLRGGLYAVVDGPVPALVESMKFYVAVAVRYACHRIQFFRKVTPEHTRRAGDLGLIRNLFWSDDPVEGLAYARNGIDVILTNCANTMVRGGFDAFTNNPETDDHTHRRHKP